MQAPGVGANLGQPVGNSGRGTRVTVDGGSIMAVGNGGSHMAFSQELVQSSASERLIFTIKQNQIRKRAVTKDALRSRFNIRPFSHVSFSSADVLARSLRVRGSL